MSLDEAVLLIQTARAAEAIGFYVVGPDTISGAKAKMGCRVWELPSLTPADLRTLEAKLNAALEPVKQEIVGDLLHKARYLLAETTEKKHVKDAVGSAGRADVGTQEGREAGGV